MMLFLNKLFSVTSLVMLLVYFRCCSWTHADLFSDVENRENLLATSKSVIYSLDTYIKKEERRINILNKYLSRFKNNDEKAKQDLTNYLENPINSFILIKELTVDLGKIENLNEEIIEYKKNTKVKYPTYHDLNEAIENLKRFQLKSHLNAKEIADGKFGTPMTASDCYEIGNAFYKEDDYENGVPWMLETYERYKAEEKEGYTFTAENIENLINFAYYSLDDTRGALGWVKSLMNSKAEDLRSNDTAYLIQYYEKRLAEKELADHNGNNGEKKLEDLTDENLEKFPVFKMLCRNKMDLPSDITRRLKCRYLTEHPFLMLAPIKLEELYSQPEVVMLYEVMSDEEIQHIKILAKPTLQHSKVYDPNLGTIMSKCRTSMSGWLENKKSDVIARISLRVSEFTGFTMETAEDLQVGNYGVGGHYDPHHDFFTTQNMTSGNRIATVLIYMSDVEQGGATVFTDLGLTVFPVKGAALFWMNLLPTGEGDPNTTHGACPVLSGTKWVATKWIHQHGQELSAPCTLNKQKNRKT